MVARVRMWMRNMVHLHRAEWRTQYSRYGALCPHGTLGLQLALRTRWPEYRVMRPRMGMVMHNSIRTAAAGVLGYRRGRTLGELWRRSLCLLVRMRMRMGVGKWVLNVWD